MTVSNKNRTFYSCASKPRRRKISRGPPIQQPPMVFDLSEPSDNSEDYIFGKPKNLTKKRRKTRKGQAKVDEKKDVKKENKYVFIEVIL